MIWIQLEQTRRAWDTGAREAVLKAELEGMDAAELPLQQALARGSQVAPEPFRVLVMETGVERDWLRARVGILFTGIIVGCQCADDPGPPETLPEYAELEIWVDRQTGAAHWRLCD